MDLGVQVVQHSDPVTPIQELVYGVGADEAGSAGHENMHGAKRWDGRARDKVGLGVGNIG